jgi:hypothetical protein
MADLLGQVQNDLRSQELMPTIPYSGTSDWTSSDESINAECALIAWMDDIVIFNLGHAESPLAQAEKTSTKLPGGCTALT